MYCCFVFKTGVFYNIAKGHKLSSIITPIVTWERCSKCNYGLCGLYRVHVILHYFSKLDTAIYIAR